MNDQIDVVGIGAGGWESLGAAEKLIIESAGVIFGAARQLGLVPLGPTQQSVPWPQRLRAELPSLLAAHDGSRVVVLASGDPMLAGVGSTLVELLGPERVRVHPAVSSASLAIARLGWASLEVQVVRITSDDAAELAGRTTPGARMVLLCRDGGSLAMIMKQLTASGFGSSRLSVFGDLGAASESRLDLSADAVPPTDLPRLHLVAVECSAPGWSPAWSAVPGLPEEVFDHDGQISKRIVRAAALAHLRPAPGELLWDLGAGAGSVSVEWCRAAAGARAIAVERDVERAARIGRNARALGATVQVVTGVSTEALTWMPAPDAVFVGGGAEETLLNTVLTVLGPGGRLVVHAVTLETETLLSTFHDRHGGELTRIAVEDAAPLGRYRGWSPARTVTQWSLRVRFPAEEPR